ncbi:MAG: S8 family serine peptidase, partial [Micrococcales bacterium]|nr:S8 family serine peptidase [Micrococcales bacterium]
ITNYNYAEYDRTVGEDDEVDCTTGTQAAALMVADAPGFVAVAPGARLLALRARQDGALPGTEEGDPIANYADAVLGGIEYKVDVLVITQSTQETPKYRAAIEAAQAAGIVIVAAAPILGSSGDFPASADGVISVGASGEGDIAAKESQPLASGQVTLAAPGDNIPTISPSGPGGAVWAIASGTSLAAAQVGATAALLIAYEPDLTPEQVAERLTRTADTAGITPPDPVLGAGIVNPIRALTEGSSSSASPSTQSPTAPNDPRDRAGTNPLITTTVIAIAGAAVVLAGLVILLSIAIPAANRRHRASRDEDAT